MESPEVLDHIRRAKTGEPRSQEWLLKKYDLFVWSFVRRYARRDGIDEDSLAQAGRWGLVVAWRMFDPGRERKFTTFAGFRIQHEIRRTASNDRTIHIPAWVPLTEITALIAGNGVLHRAQPLRGTVPGLFGETSLE